MQKDEKEKEELNESFTSKLSKKLIWRVMAWICLIIIIGLIIATIVSGIKGSKLFLPFLILTIIIPGFMYIVLWIGKLLNMINSNHNNDKNK